MITSEKTRELLLRHAKTYPALQIRDVFKFLFQSAFGCEHLLASFPHVLQRIREEAQNRQSSAAPCTEALAGPFCRVHLSALDRGLSPETLARLFLLSGQLSAEGLPALEAGLQSARELVLQGTLPFSLSDWDTLEAKWREDGFPALHHSPIFRQTYAPAYRVAAHAYAIFLPLFAKLDVLLQKGPVRLAIEGGSAGGKSTLGTLLEKVYDCALFHMDDFFLRPHQRTEERLAQPGGNIDRERFREEVLLPLQMGRPVTFRPFSCASQTLLEPRTLPPKKLTVIEGVYSMHPDLQVFYDLSLFLEVSPSLQKERIQKRNAPKEARRFFSEWIPLENRYFSAFHIKERCSLCLPVQDTPLSPSEF